MSDASDGQPVDVLLVEDNPGDVRLTEEAFDRAGFENELHVVTDGEEALDYLHRRGDHAEVARPNLVLLDLNLPKVGGLEVLAEIKADPDLRHTPVIVLTSSKAEEDVVRSYELHSNAYLTKPIDPGEFMALVRTFQGFWCELVRLPPTQE